MTKEKQRIAIAKACGWTEFAGELHKCYAPNGVSCYWSDTPDYLNDLNACHEAENVLTDEQRIDFSEHLSVIAARTMAIHMDNPACLFKLANATAAQRTEAFLRTLNLWTD